jgi:ketosteroid isomerase-like protein
MSEENIEVVRRTMDAFNRGGPGAVVDGGFLSPDVVFDGSRTGIPGVDIYRGLDQVRTFFEEDWFDAFPFEKWEIQIREPIAQGDQVIFASRQQGRGASSGVEAALELGNIFTLRNGEIVRMEAYRHPEDALEAAGLSD